jgi:anti-anti-sigma regulatory factor
MENHQEAGQLDVSLAETLDISTVQNLHADLKTALDNGDPVSLNGSAVVHIDTAALQVLAAMFIDAGGRQRKLEWRSPSEALVRSAQLLGIDEYIGLKSKKKLD